MSYLLDNVEGKMNQERRGQPAPLHIGDPHYDAAISREMERFVTEVDLHV